MTISHWLLAQWVEPDTGIGLSRWTCTRGRAAITPSGTGGSVTPVSWSSRSAWRSATRSASSKVSGRTGTSSRRVAMMLATAFSRLGFDAVAVFQHLEVLIEPFDGLVGQVVFGPQVGTEVGQRVRYLVARQGIEVLDGDAQCPGDCLQLLGSRCIKLPTLKAGQIRMIKAHLISCGPHCQALVQPILLAAASDL